MTGVLSAADLLKLGKTVIHGDNGKDDVIIQGNLDITGETTFHNLDNENFGPVTITEIYDNIKENKENIKDLNDEMNLILIDVENHSNQIKELDDKIERYKCTCKPGSGTGSGTNPGDGNENEGGGGGNEGEGGNEGGGGNGEGNLPENFEQFVESVDQKFQDQDKKIDDINNVLQ